MNVLTDTEMNVSSIRWYLALLARQVAKTAKRNPELNDIADALYVACVQCGVPKGLLPQ